MKKRVLVLISYLIIFGINNSKEINAAGEITEREITIKEIEGYIPNKNIKNIESKTRLLLKDNNKYPIIKKVILNFEIKNHDIFMYNDEIGIKYENEELRIINDRKKIEIVKAKDKKKLLENSDSSSVILMGANYSGDSYTVVVDMKNEKNLVIESAIADINGDDKNIFLTKLNGGFIRVNNKDKRVENCYILPNRDNIRGVIEDVDRVYISSTDGAFYYIDKITGEINIIDEIDENIKYTNMIKIENKIYLGKRKRYINKIKYENEIILFDTNTGEIKKINLYSDFGLIELRKIGERIFVIGNGVNHNEIGEGEYIGGVGIIEGEKIKLFSELDKKRVTVKIDKSGKELFKTEEMEDGYYKSNLYKYENDEMTGYEFFDRKIKPEDLDENFDFRLTENENEILNKIKCNIVIYGVEKSYQY